MGITCLHTYACPICICAGMLVCAPVPCINVSVCIAPDTPTPVRSHEAPGPRLLLLMEGLGDNGCDEPSPGLLCALA